MKARPWHDKALQLRADGVSLVNTANECDVALTTLKRFLWPEYRARQAKLVAECRKRRLAADPAFRQRYSAMQRRNKRVSRLRKDAKCEAYDTGRRYEDVCAAWDITP